LCIDVVVDVVVVDVVVDVVVVDKLISSYPKTAKGGRRNYVKCRIW